MRIASLFVLLLSCNVVFAQVASVVINITAPWYFGPQASSPKFNATQRLRLGVISYQNSYLIGILMAAQYINNRTDILPDTAIDLYITNYTTSSNTALFATVYHIVSLNVLAILGPQTSSQAATSQAIAKLYNVPEISGSAISYLLSDKTNYPTFVRTVCPDNAQISGIISLFQSVGWQKGLVIYAQNDYGSGYTQLVVGAAKKNISLASFGIDPSGTTAAYYNNTAKQINDLVQAGGYRIFVMYVDLATASIAQAMINANITGPDYVYIYTGGYADQFTINTSSAFKSQYLQGALGFGSGLPGGPLYTDVMKYAATSGTNLNSISTFGKSQTNFYTFDSVWVTASAVDSLLNTGTSLKNITGPMLQNQIITRNITGVTNEIVINQNGDRLGTFELWNWFGPNTSRTLVHAGTVSTIDGTFTMLSNLTFFDGTNNIPRDSPYTCGSCVYGTCVVNVGCVCDDGYTGLACDVKEHGSSSTNIVPWLVPVIAAMVIAFVGAYYLYQRKKRALVKEVADKQRSQIARTDLALGERVGRGAAGEVLKGQFRGTDVAVKKIITNNVAKGVIEEFELEVAIMCGLRHPNIVLFMGSCYDPSSQEMLLVMEFMARGSLNDVLNNPKIPLPYDMQLHLASQAAQGMNFLHQSSPPIIHHDLKSHNILIDDKWNARISDFGITKFKESDKKSKNQSNSLGTIYWSAPELLNAANEDKNVTEKIDCYSFGIVLWEIFHRQNPYVGRDPMSVAMDVVRKNLRPTISPDVPAEMQTLIRSCWAPNPDERPSFQEIVTKLRMMSMRAPVTNYSGVARPVDAPTGRVFLVKTDIVGAYQLWDMAPRSMEEAMRLHNQLIRLQLDTYRGYEASFVNHSFDIAFATLEEAINFCIAAQVALLHVPWPTDLLSRPEARPIFNENGALIWKGLRVKMAVTVGVPNCEADSGTGRIKYFGSAVDKLQNMLALSAAGVLVSAVIAEEVERAPPHFLQKVTPSKLGNIKNSARDKSETVHLLTIESLEGRSSGNSSGSMPHAIVDMEDGEVENISVLNSVDNNPVEWITANNEIVLRESLGKGSVGDYYRAEWRGKEVAAKVLVNQKLKEDDLCRLISDSAYMSKLTHPNLLPFYAICLEPNHVCIISELGWKSLKNLLADTSIPLTHQKKVSMMLSLAQGMQYLTSLSDPAMQMHDTLKSNNVLIGKNWDVRVADYGHSNIRELARTMTSVGNIAWTAPEILNGEPATLKISTYAFGIILWETYTRQIPYPNEHPIRVVAKIINGYRPPVPTDCPTPYQQLINACLRPEAQLRPSWNEIIQELSAMK